MKTGRPRIPLADRFWAHVDKGAPDDCWPWTGERGWWGHGMMGYGGRGGKHTMASHVAYELSTGSRVKQGLVIDHLCNNPPCVNPRHLRMVTQKENVLRSTKTIASINAAKTHCQAGHAFDAVDKEGGRFCRRCYNQRKRILYRKKNGLPGPGRARA